MLLFFGPPFIAEETAGGRVALHSGAFLVHAAQCDPRLRHLAAAVHRHHRDGGKGLGYLGHSHLLAWNHGSMDWFRGKFTGKPNI